MKFGFRTNLWGVLIGDLEAALDEIAETGFAGVEFAQRPAELRVRTFNGAVRITIDQLISLLTERGLNLVGLAGGSLQQRIEFCGEYRPDYLYVEDWPSDPTCVSRNDPFTLALHPHMFKRVHRLAHASALLEQHQKLKFIPDSAHLTIAGDCPIQAIEKWKTRLAAVHLKDWTPEFGRSSFHYAKGFASLGTGIVKLDAILKKLNEINYDGWVIVEQDNPGAYDIVSSIHASAEWLRSRGVISTKAPKKASQTSQWQEPTNARMTHFPSANFMARILSAACDSDRSHQIIAQAFHELIPSYFANVWKYSPAQDLLCLSGLAGQIKPSKSTMRGKDVLSGETIDQTYVRCFDLTRQDVRNRFGDQDILAQLGDKLHTMISIPIPNLWNKNHVWLLVNVFPLEPSLSISPDDLMQRYTTPIAEAIRCSVEERCFRATTLTSYLSAQPLIPKSRRSADDFLHVLCELLQRVLDCQSVHAFLVNNDKDRLEHRASTGPIRWCDPTRPYYTKDQGLTGKVWAEIEPSLTRDLKDSDREPCSYDDVEDFNRYETLYAPITRLASTDVEVIGVIRCRNRNQRAGSQLASMFSDEDVAVVESVINAAAPHLELRKSNDARLDLMKKLGHELGGPLVAIRGAVHQIADNAGLATTIRNAFPHDYLDDVKSWCDLMTRLLLKFGLMEGLSSGILDLRPELTRLAPDVVAPAARRVSAVLAERGFSPNQIRRGDLSDRIPPLFLDRNMFQEVAFNLLDNAIKYGYKDPSAFRVEIDAQPTASAFELYFRDYGPGIPEKLKERIFDEGFRGVDAEGIRAYDKHVIGQGFGLWFVRKIVEAHGGQVYVSNLRYPTEFTISLPKRLAQSNP